MMAISAYLTQCACLVALHCECDNCECKNFSFFLDFVIQKLFISGQSDQVDLVFLNGFKSWLEDKCWFSVNFIKNEPNKK